MNTQKSAVTLPAQQPANAYLLEGIVRVCMHCHPGDTILDQNRHWRGLSLRISHGLCAAHKAEMMAGVRDLEEAA